MHISLFLITVDYNRVVLEPEEGVPDSDYINASYVDVSITNVTYCLVPHSSNPDFAIFVFRIL